MERVERASEPRERRDGKTWGGRARARRALFGAFISALFFKKKIFVVRRKAAIASTGRTRTRGKGGGAGVRSGGKADVTVRGAW